MSNYKIGFSNKAKPLFQKKVNPAKIDYDGDPDIEQDSEKELTELQKSFRQRAQDVEKEKAKNTSSEFWSCVVFQNQEQRDEFCRLLGLKETDNQYINGKKLIQALKLNIPTENQSRPGKFKANNEILNLSIKPDFLT